jgi:hypothetical protein
MLDALSVADATLPPTPEASTGAADAAAMRELLGNGGFEELGGLGCGLFWTAGPGTTADLVDANTHSGQYACRLCGAGPYVTHDPIPFAGPGTYVAVAYFRHEGDASPATRIQLLVDYGDASDYPIALGAPSSDGTYSANYFGYVVEAGVVQFGLQVGEGTEQVGCVVVDDVSLAYSP